MSKGKKRGIIMLVIGLAAVMCALFIHIEQQQRDKAAGETAAMLMQQLETEDVVAEVQEEAVAEDPELPVKKYKNYVLIGSISVPSVGIELPVLDGWSEEMLEAAPCRYAGSISDGNMIIMGHNYRSHFTPLRDVALGAEVMFKNTADTVFRYEVKEIEYLHRSEGEQLPSEYPLTLFTCTPGGLDRIIVRCDIAE